MAKVTLQGSERTALPGARVIAAADPAERLEVSMIIRRGAAEACEREWESSPRGIARRDS